MLFGSPPFVQDAGIAALTGPQEAIAAMRDAYARRARLVVDALARRARASRRTRPRPACS